MATNSKPKRAAPVHAKPPVHAGRVAPKNPAVQAVKLKMAQANASKAQAESDRLNSFGNLAKETVLGLPKAVKDIGVQTFQHPLRTAGHIGTGVFNEGIRPVMNLPLMPTPWQVPRINFKPNSPVEEGIQQGFGVGGMAGGFYAGNAALRPLMESKAVVGAMGKIFPSAINHATKIPQIKPFVQGLMSDQILTQALVDRNTPLVDRGINAALTPAFSLGLHALGRSRGVATARVNESIGKGLPEDLRGADLTNPNVHGLSDEQALARLRQTQNVEDRIVDPKTGQLDTQAMVTRALAAPKGEVKVKNFLQKVLSKIGDAFTSTRTRFNRTGPAAKAFVTSVDEVPIEEAKFFTGLQKAVTAKLEAATKANPDFWARFLKAVPDEATGNNLMYTAAERDALLSYRDAMEGIHKYGVAKKWTSQGIGGEKIPWGTKVHGSDIKAPFEGQNPRTYFPRAWSKAAQATPDYKKGLVAGYMKQGLSRSEAELAASQEMGAHLRQKDIGSLAYARVNEAPGWRTDIGTISEYFKGVANKQARTEILGTNNEKILPLLDRMSEEGISIEDITKVLDETFGNELVHSPLISFFLKWNQVTKLPLSFFQNLTQSANTATVAGVLNTAKSVFKYFTSATDRAFMKDFAQTVGALDNLNITAEAGTVPSKIVDKALWLFKKSEEFNRVIAADASREYLRAITTTLRKDPMNGEALRGLGMLGLMLKDIPKGGMLNESILARAAHNFVNNTQFNINSLNLPLWSRSPIGKIFSQFKSFGYMQTGFVRDSVFNELKNGNVKPLLRMAAVLPGLYVGAKKMRDIVTFREDHLREYFGLSPNKELTQEQKDEYWFNMVMNASGMLPAQMYQSAEYVRQNAFGEGAKYKGLTDRASIIAGNALGPTVSDIGGIARSFSQGDQIMKENLLSGNEGPGNQLDPTFPMQRLVANWVPYVGPLLKNAFFKDWPQREREIFRKNLKDGFSQYMDTRDPGLLKQIVGSLKDKSEVNVFNDVKAEVMREKLPPETKSIYDSIQARKKELNKLPFLSYGQVQ